MSSVHKIDKSEFWYCAFGAGGKRHFKSTKTKNKKQAEVICGAYERAAKKAITGTLNADAAREVIAQGVADILLMAGDELPSATVREWSERWLESKTVESEPTTLTRYRGIVAGFLAHLGKTADRNLVHVTSTHIEAFRNHEAKRLTTASANTALKIVRAMLSSAVAKQLITRNPASADFVKVIDKDDGTKRRPLTIAEIKKLLIKAEGTEWKGMILLGIYTGQRMGDIRALTWRSLDFEADTIALTTQKTGRRMVLPLAKPLRACLENLDAPDDPDAFLFPVSAKIKHIGHLSNSFRDLLAEAGLVKEKTSHVKKGAGRGGKRVMSEISFHSLRHSAVTFLKAAGATDVLAREIVGHDSATVSRSYTHLATEDLRPSIDRLPDVTK